MHDRQYEPVFTQVLQGRVQETQIDPLKKALTSLQIHSKEALIV